MGGPSKYIHNYTHTHTHTHIPATTEQSLYKIAESLLQCQYEKTFRDTVNYVNMFVLVRPPTLSSSLSLCYYRRRRRRRHRRCHYHRFCCCAAWAFVYTFRLKRSKSFDGGINASVFVISSSTFPLFQPKSLSFSFYLSDCVCACMCVCVCDTGRDQDRMGHHFCSI